VADVEAVNRLHQAADRLLEQVGVAEGVVAEALGHVGSQADVGRCQAVLEVDVAVVQPADRQRLAGLSVAVVADELGHRPGFQRRPVLAQPRKVPDQHTNQLALAIPEIRQQLALLFGGEQVRGKDGRGGEGSSIPVRRLALATSRLHGRLSQ
jgi:hypothetical protein